MSRYFIAPEPAAESTPTYDYGTVYGNISTYLNQVREELADINVDTTAAAASLGTMATNSTTMATNSTTMATNITTIASKLTDIETYQKKMKELGEGPGIHIVGAYDVFQMVSIYKLLIEQAQILENAGASAGTAAAQAEVTRVSQLIKSNIPRDF
jgi:ribosomal protein RSM22 (predicted rRNA methylase)